MFRGRGDRGKCKNYTPLNDLRTHILIWIRKNDKEVRWPSKLNLNKASRRDKTKYYRFHEDHGHTTEECQQLKDKIERLIRDDTLQKFTKKDREERRLELEVRTLENTIDNESVGVIHVIASSPNDGKGKNKLVAEDVLSVE